MNSTEPVAASIGLRPMRGPSASPIPSGPSVAGSYSPAARGVTGSVSRSPSRSTSRSTAVPARSYTVLTSVPEVMTRRPSTSKTMSPGWRPATSAGEPGLTASIWMAGAPSTRASQNRKSAAMKFMPAPAASTNSRTRFDAADRPPGTLGSSSPAGRTKPPTGIQLRE